jgi:hypothetical protein
VATALAAFGIDSTFIPDVSWNTDEKFKFYELDKIARKTDIHFSGISES